MLIQQYHSSELMDVRHTAIEVVDLDAMRDFYEGLLGLDRSREFKTKDTHNYYVVGSGTAEIQFRVVDEKATPAGIHHIAVTTDDVDTTVDEAVAEWDSDVEMEPRTLDRVNQRIAFITDPEGYTVELIEDL